MGLLVTVDSIFLLSMEWDRPLRGPKGSERVTMDELRLMYLSLLDARAATNVDQLILNEAFRVFDADGNGTLRVQELMSTLEALMGETQLITPAEAAVFMHIMEASDENHDSLLDYREFSNVVQSKGPWDILNEVFPHLRELKDPRAPEAPGILSRWATRVLPQRAIEEEGGVLWWGFGASLMLSAPSARRRSTLEGTSAAGDRSARPGLDRVRRSVRQMSLARQMLKRSATVSGAAGFSMGASGEGHSSGRPSATGSRAGQRSFRGAFSTAPRLKPRRDAGQGTAPRPSDRGREQHRSMAGDDAVRGSSPGGARAPVDNQETGKEGPLGIELVAPCPTPMPVVPRGPSGTAKKWGARSRRSGEPALPRRAMDAREAPC